MLTEQTLDIMRALRLPGMLEALEEQYRMPKINDLSFDERLGLLTWHPAALDPLDLAGDALVDVE